MTKEEFDKFMSSSAKWVIQLACDGDYQSISKFTRKEITIEDMFKQYSYIMEENA